MENKNTDTRFQYTYSANEQDEIKRIRQKYQVQEEDDISKLHKLDAKVTQKATMSSLAIGIVGALILGSGMSLVMTDLGTIMGMQGLTTVILGSIVGILGIVFITMAYPVYKKVLKKERAMIAPEILRLTDELMK